MYTATQAVENGLIDKVEGWEEALALMEEKTGVEGYKKQFASSATLLDHLLYGVVQIMPQSDMEVMEEITSSQLSGVPLYMMVD